MTTPYRRQCISFYLLQIRYDCFVTIYGVVILTFINVNSLYFKSIILLRVYSPGNIISKIIVSDVFLDYIYIHAH